MGERRKEERKKVMAFTPVYDFRQGVLLGYLADLTMQGAMVIGGKCLQVDDQVMLNIEIPGDLPNISVKNMTIKARVARCVPDDSPTSFRIGLEFLEVETEKAEIIQAFLDRYHFRHQV